MPNYCTNILDVTGDEKELAEFRKRAFRIEKATAKNYQHDIGDEYLVFDFNGTVPRPPEYENTSSPPQSEKEAALQEELLKKYGSSNWYDWSIKNWGCKWNASDATEEEIDGGIRVWFSTPWCPPVEWISRTAAQFPSLKFSDSWNQEGCGRFEVWTEDGELQTCDQDMSEHDWNMEFDSCYRDEYEFITEGAYDEVVEKYLEEELNFSALSEFLLKRLKDSDLPLFIHFEWMDQQDAFEQRIKGKPITTEVSHDNEEESDSQS